MKIWVDGDACPVVIKEIIYRAAERTQTDTYFVANHFLKLPKSRYIRLKQVESGFDVADNFIAQQVEAGDLVITGDIPLASEVIDKQCAALSPRGELFSEDNIRARLNIRDFMDTLRASGMDTGGTPSLSQADRQQFANHLDTILRKNTP